RAQLHSLLELAAALLRRADDVLRLRPRLLQRQLGFVPRLLGHRLDETVQRLARVSGLMQLALEDRELLGEDTFAKLDTPDAREQVRALVVVPSLLDARA